MTAFAEACFIAAAPTQVINIIIMPKGGLNPCAKCGEIGHTARTCKSSKELRNKCACDGVKGLDWCGEHIASQDWQVGKRIHRKCKHFLARAKSLLALIGTKIPGRRATIKEPKKTVRRPGENDCLYAQRQAQQDAGGSRRTGNSGPSSSRKVMTEAQLKEKMKAEVFDAIMAAPLTPEQDDEGRWRIPRAKAIVQQIDLASPIRTRLAFRRPDAAGRSKRERLGDPTVGRSDEPTLATIFSIDCLVYLLASSSNGLKIQVWDVENKDKGARFKDIRDNGDGLGAAYVDICWETCISHAPCLPCAKISRTAYAVADMSGLTIEKRWDAVKQKYYHVCSGDASVSEAEQKAVLDQRDLRLPLCYQNGPEREMGPFLRKDIWLWDMYAALSRAAGHENTGANNELIYLPLNSEALAFFFGIKFEHRAEPDTIDEIKFCQALGFEIYQLLKEDPECPIDEIIEKRFPGTDPTKWDFSSFKRSADAAPSKKRKRATRKPFGVFNESDDE